MLPRGASLGGALLPLLVLATTLSVAHAIVTPALWPVDETSHVAYADHLYREGELPRIDTPIPADLPYPGYDQRLAWEQREDHPGRMDIWTANHPPLPFLIQGAALRIGLAFGSPSLALLLARLTATLWLLAAVVMTVRLTERLVPNRPRTALAAGLFVAVTPTVSHLAGLVFNDVAGLAASTACLLAGVVIATEGPTPGRVGRLGLAAGVAALVRVSCLPAIAIGVALAIFGHLHHRRPGGILPRQLVGAWAGAGAMLLPAAGFYLLNIARYGDIGAVEWLLAKFGRDPNTPIADLVVNGVFWRRLWARLIGDLTTGHWSSGWPASASVALLALAVGALLWLGAATMTRGRPSRRLTRPEQRMLAIWVACLGLPLALVASTVSFHSAGGSLHGRYVVGAHAVTAAVVAIGIGRLPRVGRHAIWLIGAPLLATNLGLLHALITDPNKTWMRGGRPLPLPPLIGVATTPALWVLAAVGVTMMVLLLRTWARLPEVDPALVQLRAPGPGTPLREALAHRLPPRALRLASTLTERR